VGPCAVSTDRFRTIETVRAENDSSSWETSNSVALNTLCWLFCLVFLADFLADFLATFEVLVGKTLQWVCWKNVAVGNDSKGSCLPAFWLWLLLLLL